jgi:hypothetical protein
VHIVLVGDVLHGELVYFVNLIFDHNSYSEPQESAEAVFEMHNSLHYLEVAVVDSYWPAPAHNMGQKSAWVPMHHNNYKEGLQEVLVDTDLVDSFVVDSFAAD